MSELDDGALLTAWSEGDRSAGTTLLQRHFRLLYRFFRNKVSDGVEDLVQQTMMACTKAVGRYRGESSFKTFLLGIARHELLMHLRKHARKHAPLQPLEMSVVDVMDSPSQLAAVRSEQELVAEAMRNIPVELQITLELFYWEDLKVAEIAAVTDVAVGTVKSRLSRGRGLLKRWLEQQESVASELRDASVAVVASME
ncbi:MAG: RNA polymerase sigma factor [Myxococcota bacterium]